MDTPIEHVPQQVSEALGWRSSTPVEPVEHPAVTAPFGYFQRTVKPPDPDDEEIDFETPVAKLFHGSTHTDDTDEFAFPEINLADYEFEDRETSSALFPLKKIFSDGRYGITATSPEPPADILEKWGNEFLRRAAIAPTPANNPGPTTPLAKSVLTIVEEMKREGLVERIKRQLDEGETIESLAAYAEESSPEHATLIRQIGVELEKASGDVEPVTVPYSMQELMDADAAIGGRDDGEDDESYFGRMAAELAERRTPTPLGTPKY